MEDYIWQIALLIATNGTTWFFSRDRQKADTRQVEIENIKEQFKLLTEMSRKNLEHANRLEDKLRTTNQFVTDVVNFICVDSGCMVRKKGRIMMDDLGPHFIIDEDNEQQ